MDGPRVEVHSIHVCWAHYADARFLGHGPQEYEESLVLGEEVFTSRMNVEFIPQGNDPVCLCVCVCM